MDSDSGRPLDPRAARARRSAKAHWLLAGVTRRQGELHRELATLLEKEAEAHTVLDRWAREGAARQEAGAHRDLARRSDARTLWHKTVAVLLLRSSQKGGGTVKAVTPEEARAEAGGRAEKPADGGRSGSKETA